MGENNEISTIVAFFKLDCEIECVRSERVESQTITYGKSLKTYYLDVGRTYKLGTCAMTFVLVLLAM